MKRKYPFGLRCLILSLIFVFVLQGTCVFAVASPRLDTPENLDLSTRNDHLYLSWDKVSDAAYYEVTILKTTDLFLTPIAIKTSEKNRIMLDNPLLSSYPGTFVFYVRAFAEDPQICSFLGKSKYYPLLPIDSPVDLSAGDWFAVTNNKSHLGSSYGALDLNLPENKDDGLPVYAVAEGEVLYPRPVNGQVQILHDYPLITRTGKIYDPWYTIYAHMDPLLAKRGTVHRGDLLGMISDKGSKFGLAHGPHLHFAISTDRYSTENETGISPYWVYGPLTDLSLYTYDTVDLCKEHILQHLPE